MGISGLKRGNRALNHAGKMSNEHCRAWVWTLQENMLCSYEGQEEKAGRNVLTRNQNKPATDGTG